MADLDKANTLDEAALNPDGKTYNGAKAISWMAAVLGHKISPEEVTAAWEKAKAKKRG